MRSLIVISAVLVVFSQCGYPVPEYPVAAYPVPAYPVAYVHPAPSSSVYSDTLVDSDAGVVHDSTAVENCKSESCELRERFHSIRRRAKARTVQNRQFHRRPLQPIRRQKKAKQ